MTLLLLKTRSFLLNCQGILYDDLSTLVYSFFRTGNLSMDRDMIGHLVGPDNSNINKLRAKIQKVRYDLLYKYSLFPLNQHSENVKNAKNVIC